MTTPIASTVVPTPALPFAAPKDFPTWLPAMLVKELRRGLRTRGFVGALVVFQSVMVFAMLGALVGGSVTTPAARASAFNGVNGFFWALVTIQLLIATPLRALAALRGEIDSRAIDLLMLTRLSAWRIVFGKWSSLVVQATLLLIAMLPYGVVRYFGGSVDLMQDGIHCIEILGGCAVITAFAVWASGMPRGMQIVVPVVIVVLMQMGTFLFRSGGPVFATLGVIIPLLWWIDGAVVLVFFLVAAVRRIAPPADNHAPIARALVLIPLLTVPLAVELWSASVARAQFAFAASFLGIFCAIELATARVPMRIHWQPWASRGAFPRLIGRVVMPGWPSALLFTALAAGLTIAITYLPGLTPSAADRNSLIWIVILAVCAVASPLVVMELLPRATAKSPAGIYILVFAGMTAFAAIAAGVANDTWLDAFAHVLPISSFWRTLFDSHVPKEIEFAQGGFGFVFLGIAAMQSRRFWQWLAAVKPLERPAGP
jgi:hypothetical protein